jgi:hypothetical protein
MAKNTKYHPGQSGNPTTQFQPGNRHRWQSGQSGNPNGVARNRLRFEEAFYAALIGQGAPEEVATLLWECARAREPWAVQVLLQRIAPEMKQIRLMHEGDDGTSFDFQRFNDAELEQFEQLLEKSRGSVAPTESRESATQPEGVCEAGLGHPGTRNEVH